MSDGTVRPVWQVLASFTAVLAEGKAIQPALTTHGLLPISVFGSTGTPLPTSTAADLAAVTQPNALLSASPGEWTITNFPATNTAASATKAAGGAGVRHVLRSIAFDIVDTTGVTPGPIRVVVRDGATGVGTVLWNGVVYPGLIGQDHIALAGLNIVGSANTALTIEFVTAGGAATQESVSASGYSTV